MNKVRIHTSYYVNSMLLDNIIIFKTMIFILVNEYLRTYALL